jgi:hypothetical protein
MAMHSSIQQQNGTYLQNGGRHHHATGARKGAVWSKVGLSPTEGEEPRFLAVTTNTNMGAQPNKGAQKGVGAATPQNINNIATKHKQRPRPITRNRNTP